MQLTAEEMRIIQEILGRYRYTFYAYGSRTKGTARPFSDLDLCYKDPIPDTEVGDIREAFDESDLPFRVELVAWRRCTPQFQQLITPDLVRLSPPEGDG